MKVIRKVLKEYYVRQILTCSLSVWMLFGSSLAMATPSGGVVSPDAGGANITYGTGTYNHTTQVDALTNQTIVDWTSLDTAGGAAEVRETLKFTQDVLNSAVLNRVSGPQTQFNGDLIANGMNIFVVNPAGIVFGEGATVNVAQLIASSLDITNNDFINGVYDFAIPGTGEVVNYGTIAASKGAALLGRRVENAGTISAGEDGFVVMAAGDRVLLGEPGSSIVVEMSSVDTPGLDEGEVINTDTGQISSPSGEIVLAAGDIFSTALDNKVLFGTGNVTQSGVINSDGTTGDGGTVTLTSADETVLNSASLTTANAGTDADSGLVTVHSADRTVVEYGAQIEAKGGHLPTVPPGETGSFPLEIVTENSIEIIGDTVSFAGDVDATATDPLKNGKILVEADNLTIAEGPLLSDPGDNTIYEDWIEGQSSAGTDLELLSHSSSIGNITVNGLDDGVISLAGGDLALYTKFKNGGITFLENTDGDPATIHSTYGGNIFMTAGAGGILAGDLLTDDSDDSSHTIEAGRIRVFTDNEGDIDVGAMMVNGGNITEISAIASGNLTVRGGAISKNASVNQKDEKEVGFARICLISSKNIIVDTTARGDLQNPLKRIVVDAHGKYETTANIRICAGQDITLNVFDTGGNPGVKATASSSEQTKSYQSAQASVFIGAGRYKSGDGIITINGDSTEDPDWQDNFHIELATSISGEGSLDTNPQDTVDSDGDGDPWHDVAVNPPDGGDAGARHEVHLIIDPKITNDSICAECPKPPTLVLDVIANDDFASEHMDTIVDTLTTGQTDIIFNDEGDILRVVGYSSPTDTATGRQLGSLDLVEVYNPTTEKYEYSFEYTPAEGYAETVAFEYVIIDLTSGAIDDAVVTIDLTNSLPDGDTWLGTTHMDTEIVDSALVAGADTFTDAEGDTVTVKADTYSGDSYSATGIYGGDLSYDGDYTYSPDTTNLDGYVGDDSDDFLAGGYDVDVNPDEKFTVKLSDGQRQYVFDGSGNIISDDLVYSDGTVSVDITNSLPSGSGDLGSTPEGTVLTIIQNGVSDPVSVDDLIDKGNGYFDTLSHVVDSYTGSAGGTLEFNGNEWIYTPAPGHIGGEEFTIDVWDGQNEYAFTNGEIVSETPNYGSGKVTVDVTKKEEEEVLPVAPLPVLQEPEIEGCPVLMDAVAMELGITSETIQVSINRALAASPAIQPCDACARFTNYAGVLRGTDDMQMATMVQTLNQIAPADMPFTPEMEASIAAVLDNAAEGTQYASMADYIDALVGYVAVLDNELGSPVGDSFVFVMERHGAVITENANPNIVALIRARIENIGG